jgi:hypothetical protein
MGIIQLGPQFIQNAQTNLNSYIPTAPRDAVWGCAKSMMVSLIATAVLSDGKVVPALKAALFASVASVVHTTVISVLKMGFTTYGITIEGNPDLKYLPHALSIGSLLTAYWVGRKGGMSLFWTPLATALPYVLTQNSTQITTPLFVAVVNS